MNYKSGDLVKITGNCNYHHFTIGETVRQLWATDTGVTGNAIDIYTPDYDYAMQCGRQSLTVWWVPPYEMEVD